MMSNHFRRSPLWTRLTFGLFRLRNRHFLLIDLGVYCLTPVAAILLLAGSLSPVFQNGPALLLYILIASAPRVVIFILFGLYSRYWRYASVEELGEIAAAIFLATLLSGGIYVLVLSALGLALGELPWTLPWLDGVLALLAVGGIRYSIRMAEQSYRLQADWPENSKRVLVLGAGEAGVMIVKEMQSNPHLGLEPVGFIDDDPQKQGALIRGLRVMGTRNDLRVAARDAAAHQAIIAMPTATGRTIRELTQLCREANMPVKTVPGMFELLDGSVTVNQLRPVDIADLLRREPVQTDTTPVRRLLKDRCVLVTGAGGSIGSELCRQMARCGPAKLVLLGHGENSIFAISNELRTAMPQLALEPVIADIRDADRLRVVMDRHRPQLVFHAAAHKHVPLMETNTEDAITNNVLGTRNLLELAAQFGVEQFVSISSDKAVRPTNIMGATKRVSELMVQAAAQRTGRRFVSVRFGNVLGSRGSVVPTFKEQIQQGGPVTVTHPEMRRYFMTIPEAVQLVLQAATLGQGGEVLALDMGEPVRILDLARDLIRLSGLEEGRDIEIVFTGLRPGEKLVEELFLENEACQRTAHKQVLIAPSPAPPFNHGWLEAQIQGMIEAARAGEVPGIARYLSAVVPEYAPAAPDEAGVHAVLPAPLVGSAVPNPAER